MVLLLVVVVGALRGPPSPHPPPLTPTTTIIITTGTMICIPTNRDQTVLPTLPKEEGGRLVVTVALLLVRSVREGQPDEVAHQRMRRMLWVVV